MTVASSKKVTRAQFKHSKHVRIAQANSFIRVIATNGRHFLSHGGTSGLLLFDDQQRVRYIDPFTKTHVFLYGAKWKGFSEGGTMRSLVQCLRQYIQGVIPTGDDLIKKLPLHMDWGYGPGMDAVRAAAQRIFSEQVDGPTPLG